MHLRLLFICLLFLFQHAFAQEYKFLVRFRDKKNNGYTLQDPSLYLSPKSVQRRQKFHISIDSTDLPLTAAYIDSLVSFPTVNILNKSRWFNQVLISVQDSSVMRQILQLSYVLSSEPVNNSRPKKFPDHISINGISVPSTKTSSENLGTLTAPYNYGASLAQVHIHHGEYLHNQGFHGEGIVVAILDNGFNNYLTNPAFDSIRNDHRILGTYDFVNRRMSVNEEGGHGSNCFSILASNIPGTLVGSAPAAGYWLFKTEDDFSETPTEEQNWIAAAEFADSAGADLISTSLGYAYFDNPLYDLSYPERDGQTALVSRAANLVVSKGMIVTASAGNSGDQPNDSKYVICPADGDSVFTIGSVDDSGQISSFSSWGPNAAGQVKPDAVSVGSGTFLIGPDGLLHSGNGTSYSNPNLAGLIACLWQAFPDFTPHDLLSAVRQSSNQYNYPGNRYGYGIPDFEKAYEILVLKKLSRSVALTADDWIRAFPVPFRESFHLFILPAANGQASIQLMDVSGKIIKTQSLTISAGQLQLLEFNPGRSLTAGTYLIRYTDQVQSKTLKVLKN
jgi:hypothetical protein